MNQILTDEEIFKLQYELQYRDGGFHPIPFARAIEQAIINKLNSAEPVGEVLWFDPSLQESPEKAGLIVDGYMSFMDKAKIGDRLYLHPPAPSEANVSLTGEGKANQLDDFIYRFKRHVGGDGEFWLHELEDFYYGEAAARSEEWPVTVTK